MELNKIPACAGMTRKESMDSENRFSSEYLTEKVASIVQKEVASGNKFAAIASDGMDVTFTRDPRNSIPADDERVKLALIKALNSGRRQPN
jgi:hypothetical protein